MSSDSDLDYESADDDIIEQNMSNKNNITEASKNMEETSDKVVPEKIVPTVESLLTEVSDKLTTSSCNSDFSESAEIVLAEECTKNKTSENKDDIGVSLSSSELKEKSSEIQVKNEKQRVPLRLEKKMQQKSQLSKESSVETQGHFSRESSVEKKNDVLKNQHSKGYSHEKSTSDHKNNYESEYNNQDLTNIGEKKSSSSSSWGFGGWGTNLLSSAASSVSSFSSQVSQGIGTVLETVESTLGAPSPEELASVLREKKESSDCTSDTIEAKREEQEASVGILPDVSAWTKVIENTGSKVLLGGLDTLELIGKKTMDMLTEGDPGLRNKRTLFTERVNLSQMLREAKEKADRESENSSASNIDVIHYSQIFDDQQGLVHLEALEMLSKQTQAKFQRLLMRHSRKEEVKKRIEEIKSICENILVLDDPTECEGFEDFESVFKKHVLELSLSLNVDNIVKTQRQLCDTLSKFENVSEEPYIDPDEIYRSSICSLAEFTARCIETFHKVAELILVQKNLSPDLEQCATNLTGLTTVMGIEINNLSSKYHKCLDSSGDRFPNFVNNQGLNITAMATNLYVEASNSNKYIQDAFQMLVPVLLVCLLESVEE